MKHRDNPAREAGIQRAKMRLERTLADEIGHQLFLSQLQLEGFPVAIEVELGELIEVNGAERPKVTVRVKL
jgi:hypothetical protein